MLRAAFRPPRSATSGEGRSSVLATARGEGHAPFAHPGRVAAKTPRMTLCFARIAARDFVDNHLARVDSVLRARTETRDSHEATAPRSMFDEGAGNVRIG
jgi:hypothetical protein